MKIIINEQPHCEETEVIINCRSADESILKLVSSIKSSDKRISGSKNGKVYVLEAEDIYYFDSVDKKTFIYTKNEVYETPLRLYELEQKLSGTDFFRASKSSIINIAHIKSFSAMFGGKLEALLENNEKLIVSRQYVPVLKHKLNF